mmetsp:Transcript_20225/g.43799  ORF Transcript_20225/g.43799 Transcript_20225/m.43799 type:complete len:314 (+) Transcript_20225:1127-2068(+)
MRLTAQHLSPRGSLQRSAGRNRPQSKPWHRAPTRTASPPTGRLPRQCARASSAQSTPTASSRRSRTHRGRTALTPRRVAVHLARASCCRTGCRCRRPIRQRLRATSNRVASSKAAYPFSAMRTCQEGQMTRRRQALSLPRRRRRHRRCSHATVRARTTRQRNVASRTSPTLSLAAAAVSQQAIRPLAHPQRQAAPSPPTTTRVCVARTDLHRRHACGSGPVSTLRTTRQSRLRPRRHRARECRRQWGCACTRRDRPRRRQRAPAQTRRKLRRRQRGLHAQARRAQTQAWVLLPPRRTRRALTTPHSREVAARS